MHTDWTHRMDEGHFCSPPQPTSGDNYTIIILAVPVFRNFMVIALIAYGVPIFREIIDVG